MDQENIIKVVDQRLEQIFKSDDDLGVYDKIEGLFSGEINELKQKLDELDGKIDEVNRDSESHTDSEVEQVSNNLSCLDSEVQSLKTIICGMRARLDRMEAEQVPWYKRMLNCFAK